MTYLYAGLGVAMLLPIMAGLQFAVALGELESSNDSVLLLRQGRSDVERQQQVAYLDSERLLLQEAIAALDVTTPLNCLNPSPTSLFDRGFILQQTYSSACSFVSERPLPVSYSDGLSRQARLFVELSGSGVVKASEIVDQCVVTDVNQRCALEQERQPS